MTAKQMAAELEVHIRTVYRCIDALCISGVPIVSEIGRDGGYYISDPAKIEPLFFDAEEQKALLHAAAFAREAGYPSDSALSRAVSKIKRFANAEQLERMKHHESSLEVIQPPSTPILNALLKEIEISMDRQTSLEIDYKSGYENTVTKRAIDPYGLVHWRSRWYAVGYCRMRGEIRSFRVDRMSHLRRTDAKFSRPPHFSAREFLLDSLLADPGSDFENHSISVRIQGPSQAIDDLCGHWLLSHALVERTGDQAHFRLDELRLYTQVPYYLLTFGGKIRIVEPEELKGCMVEIAASLLSHYQS